MKSLKAVQIIVQLNDKEQKKLTKFVHSSYFNSENKVKDLYDYIRNNLANIQDKNQVFNYLYPNEKYNDGRLRYLNGRLYKLIKQFIELEDSDREESNLSIGILKKLRTLDNKHLYQLEENKIVEKGLNQESKKSIDYQKKYLFEFERLEFYAEKQRTETKYLESLHFNLDAYYFIEKLKATCTSINQQKIYNTKKIQGFFTPLISYIEQTKMYENVPLLNIYYNAYKMLIEDDYEHFKVLKKSIDVFQFNSNEIKDAYYLALNFCIQQLNAGNKDFNNEVFEMYKTGIEKEILLKQRKLSPITFSNVVTIGLRLNRFEEVESFIEQNYRILSGSEKKSYYTFNLAKVYFEKGDFEKVTDLYNEKLIKEVLLNIQMRILQIKAFYELGNLDICESLLLSTDQLLNRKGILAYHKTVFKNFIKYSKSLLIINQHDKQSVQKLYDAIKLNKELIEKKWLLSKLDNYI